MKTKTFEHFMHDDSYDDQLNTKNAHWLRETTLSNFAAYIEIVDCHRHPAAPVQKNPGESLLNRIKRNKNIKTFYAK